MLPFVVSLGPTRPELASVSLTEPLEHIAHRYPETLHALVAAVEAKDRYTHGRSARVAELSVRLGVRLGLGPDALRQLAQAACLHDIGKIGVPDHILNKPGRFTPKSGPGSSSTRPRVGSMPRPGLEDRRHRTPQRRRRDAPSDRSPSILSRSRAGVTPSAGRRTRRKGLRPCASACVT